MGKLKQHCHCDDCGLLHWPDVDCEQAQIEQDKQDAQISHMVQGMLL